MSKATINLGKLRDLGTEELTSTLLQSRDELFRLRLGMQTNPVTSPAAVGSVASSRPGAAARVRSRTVASLADGRKTVTSPTGPAGASTTVTLAY